MTHRLCGLAILVSVLARGVHGDVDGTLAEAELQKDITRTLASLEAEEHPGCDFKILRARPYDSDEFSSVGKRSEEGLRLEKKLRLQNQLHVERWYTVSCDIVSVYEVLMLASTEGGTDIIATRIEGLDDEREIERIRRLIANDRYAEAQRPAQQLLAGVINRHGSESLHVATVSELLGHALALGGQASDPQVRELFEHALAIRTKSFGPDQPVVGATLANIAQVYWLTGDYVEARSLYERSLAILEKTLGPDDSGVATILNNYAVVLRDSGDYEEARRRLERAILIQEKIHGADHPAVAISLKNLSSVYLATGDYTEARPLAERTLAIEEASLGPDHPAVASSLNNLANLLTNTGDDEGAQTLFNRALAIYEATHGPEHPSTATILDNIANLLMDTGDYAGALQLYRRVVAIREKALGPSHPDVARALYGQAAVLSVMGDHGQTSRLLERALRIYEEALGPDHPDVSLALMALANAGSDSTRVALDRALRAETIGRHHFRLVARTMAERTALRYAAVRPSGMNLVLTLVAQAHAASSDPRARAWTAGWERMAWDALIQSRAVVLDEMAVRHRTSVSTADAATQQLRNRLGTARRQLANLTVRGRGDQDPASYRKLLDGARRAREQAERDLAAASLAFRVSMARQQVDLAGIARALPRDSALIGITRYGRRPIVTFEAYPVPGRHETVVSYMAFVLGPEAEQPTVIPLGDAEEIDRLVTDWKAEVSRGIEALDASSEGERAYRRAGEMLRSVVWDPITCHLGGATRVFVVPDGALNLVSFAALPIGEDEYLVERGPLVHYLSTERDLVTLGGEHSAGEGMLVLGGPAYDDDSLFAARRSASVPSKPDPTEAPQPFRGRRSACSDFETMRFSSLPGSMREAEAVATLWKGAAGGRIVHLSGARASETAVKRQARGKRVLHLATHGVFLGGRCGSALDATRGIEIVTKPGPPAAVSGDNPLLLSALVLAGANHRESAAPDEDDGILTAEEIAALDLSGLQWVVLSACDTGVGEIKAGEGVFGLRRAFHVAGARTLIMSLWSVEDESTRQWMVELYEGRLLRGLNTAEAVRQASLHVLHWRRENELSTHPFYWAAFVAAGDWR